MVKLATLLQQSPSEFGYEGEIWTKHRVVDIIKSHHTNYICHIVKKIGFSSQKPILKDYRQDVDKVKEFVSQKMPELKKSR